MSDLVERAEVIKIINETKPFTKEARSSPWEFIQDVKNQIDNLTAQSLPERNIAPESSVVPSPPAPHHWLTEKPIKEDGLYLFQKAIEWCVGFGRVEKGDWRQSQNPEELYFGDTPISELEGCWYGPIPEPPNKTT